MVFIPPPPPTDEGLPQPLKLNEREQALRDTFVAEYLVDYSAIRAAMRCGFPEEFAREWAPRLMSESYVQLKLKELALTPGDPKAEEDFNKQRIKQQLLREAHYYGPGSSHAARVSALKALTELYGMEAPKKTEALVKHQGGVMRAPGIAQLDSWESSAGESQDALVRDASS